MTLRSKILACALFIASVPALACPPPPPAHPPPQQKEGESEEAFTARVAALAEAEKHKQALAEKRREGFQQGYEFALWDSADLAVLAEIVAIKERKVNRPYVDSSPLVTLKILSVARGKTTSKRFQLEYTGITSCGPYGPTNIVEGAIGDRFVVFFRSGKPGMKTVLRGYSKDEAQSGSVKRVFAEYERSIQSEGS